VLDVLVYFAASRHMSWEAAVVQVTECSLNAIRHVNAEVIA